MSETLNQVAPAGYCTCERPLRPPLGEGGNICQVCGHQIHPAALPAAKHKRRGHYGFASMDPAKRREICSKGGKAAQASGRGHRFTVEEASRAGKLGGMKISQDRNHMARIGAIGGRISGPITGARNKARGLKGPFKKRQPALDSPPENAPTDPTIAIDPGDAHD